MALTGELEFYQAGSGLPATATLAEHQAAYWRAQLTGELATDTHTELEHAFYLQELATTRALVPHLVDARAAYFRAQAGHDGAVNDLMIEVFAGGGEPPDVTNPTPGTLASSNITDTSFTLTVSGAADETALHAQPYRFSTDNGSTWSPYQTSAVFNATGKSPSTAYTCVHQTRDAAGNVATGSSIVVNTGAPAGLNGTYREQRGSTANNAAGVPYNFGAAYCGDPAAGRKVWVAVSARDVAAAPSSVTIGGVAATLEASRVATGTVSIWSAAVPLNEFNDIIVTFAGTQSVCCIGVWSTIGGTVVETVVATATGTTTGTFTAATAAAQAGDFIITATSYRASIAGPQVAYNAVVERYDLAVDAAVRQASGGDLVATGAVNDLGATVSNYGAEGVMAAVVIRP